MDNENKEESWHLPVSRVFHIHIDLIPYSFLSVCFLFLPSPILLLFFPSTGTLQFSLSSSLLPASHSILIPPSLLCSFFLSTSLLPSFTFSRPSPSFLPPCELTLHNVALINEGPCPAMIAPMKWHHVTQSFLHITEGKGRTPPDSSITAQTYGTV